MSEETNHALSNAQSWLASIKGMMANYDAVQGTDDTEAEDNALQRIQESPLSVEVRNGWRVPYSESEPEEYKILLTTGGPALRITGELGDSNEPITAALEYQDWGTPWTELVVEPADYETLMAFVRCFYFGE